MTRASAEADERDRLCERFFTTTLDEDDELEEEDELDEDEDEELEDEEPEDSWRRLAL